MVDVELIAVPFDGYGRSGHLGAVLSGAVRHGGCVGISVAIYDPTKTPIDPAPSGSSH